MTLVRVGGRLMGLARWPAALTFGLASVWLAGQHPGPSFAGQSPAGGIVELVAGWSAIAVGFISSSRLPNNRFGPLLATAGFAWFLSEWPNPGAGAFIFTAGLVLYAACAPVVLHAVLSYPEGRLGSTVDRALVRLAYGTNLLLLGALPAVAFDPERADCAVCPSNLLLIGTNPAVAESVTRLGLAVALIWVFAAVPIAGWHLSRATRPARRVLAPVLVPGILFVGLFAADVVHSLARGALSNDAFDLAMWFGQAAALIGVALGVAVAWVQARRTRARVANLVIELLHAPPSGGLRDALAQLLDDPALTLGYPVAGGRVADAQGRILDQVVGLNRAVTRVTRGENPVARINHRADLLDDQARIDAVVSAGRLAFESERLQSESRVQLEDLRASRVRIVESGDAERRRLERDLHDGAQQRLVGLAIALRLVRPALGPAPDPSILAAVEQADAELQATLMDLRELAHGIFPAVLADEGLAAAIQVLAEASVFPVQLLAVPEGRLDPQVEAAAYFVIVAAISHGGATRATISARRVDQRLLVEVREDGGPFERLADLEDRVGAVNGTVALSRADDGTVSVRAEIPCAS